MGAMTESAVANAMAKIYRLRPDKAQFGRSQETLRFFNARDMMMKGEEYHYKVFTSAGSPVRRIPATTAETTEFPEAMTIGHTDVYANWANLTEFQGSFEYTDLAEAKTRDLEASIYRVATKLVGDADDYFGAQVNAALHQDSDCKMACVAAVYKIDGDTYSQASAAYLKLDEGSISQFTPGDVLDIRTGTTATVRLTVTVNDVFHTTEGPNGVADIGPGIRVTRASGTDTNFDSVADGDEIVLSGELATYNIAGFPSWFSYSTAVLSITRTATGSAWSIPYMKSWLSGTANVTLDLDAHLGEMAEELSYAVKFGRRARAREGIAISQAAMVLLGTPKLISEASRQVGDAVMYTESLSAENKKQLFGASGFDGAYWHSPLLNGTPISFAYDPVATPNTLRLLEPSSWFFIIGHTGGSHESVKWIEEGGTRFLVERGSNGRLTHKKVAGAYMWMALANDQPRANFQHSGLKASTE